MLNSNSYFSIFTREELNATRALPIIVRMWLCHCRCYRAPKQHIKVIALLLIHS